MKDDEELEEQRDKAMEITITGGSKWPGMTYEQGVEATIDWILGDRTEPPMEG